MVVDEADIKSGSDVLKYVASGMNVFKTPFGSCP